MASTIFFAVPALPLRIRFSLRWHWRHRDLDADSMFMPFGHRLLSLRCLMCLGWHSARELDCDNQPYQGRQEHHHARAYIIHRAYT